ncbi:uncharacterized protein LOC134260444, partial [Saccostrea cucullata]|uniref:uncharacterized protein LOC134260444 n=1 Tax=Saccostrea cuccullata TaxID=36930 RepID=UPI002ED047F7
MVWEGISIQGSTELYIIINGALTGIRYRDEILQPIARTFTGAIGTEFVLMDDTVPASPNIVNQYLEAETIYRMRWHSKSQDLNPIEHLLDVLQRQIQQRYTTPYNPNGFEVAMVFIHFISSAAMDGFVDSCPQNLTEAIKASTRLECGQDKYGNDQYICLPNTEKSGLVELCHNGIMGIIQRGYCLETTEGNLFSRACSRFIEGCPDDPYRSNKNYNYPACQQINTQDHCYLADPSCSATTENTFHTSGVSTTEINVDHDVYSTTTIYNQTTTIQEYETTYIGAIVGGVCAGGIVLIVLLFIGVHLMRRKQRCIYKRKEPNSETIYFVGKRESSSESVSCTRLASSVNECTSNTPLLPTYTTDDADKISTDKDDSHTCSSVGSSSSDEDL